MVKEKINVTGGERMLIIAMFNFEETVMAVGREKKKQTVNSSWLHCMTNCFLPSVSFYYVQPHSRPGCSGHFFAQDPGSCHLFDKRGFLHGGPHKE